ncbi:MAG TPA: alpha/beta hydrolase [Gemmatimonadaceae bacterium]|nr:alpha/beta hydrolase [Gemmatimonadaceae bacterium]
MSVPNDPDIFRVPVGPGAMHVERFGYGGTPVVLVHGFGTSAFLWRHVGPMLAVRQMTAYAVDLFGYGESDRPFDAEFGVRAQSDYLDRALTALQVPRAAVVGLDVGAIVAMAIASDRRDRVSQLVMIGPPALDDIQGAAIRDLQRETARHALRLSRGLFGASSLLTPFLEESVESPERMPPRLIGRYLAPFLGRDGANHLLALAGALGEEELEDLTPGAIRQKVLVVRGTRDRWCTKAIAEGYAESFPGGRYEIVDAVGHLVPEEAPEALADLIAEFVSRPDR